MGRTEIPNSAPRDWALARAGWQGTIFAKRPRRLDLLELEPRWPCRPIRVRVHRNELFETVATAAVPFLAYAGLRVTFEVGPYDDSLSFPSAGDRRVDVELVWLDYGRYLSAGAGPDLAGWLRDRLARLRSGSSAPILVADSDGDDLASSGWNEMLAKEVPGVAGARVFPRSRIVRSLGPDYADTRGVALHGSRMSDLAALHTARSLGLQWIPGAVSPGLKAVVVDLDHTLYEGVLGEDGKDGVRLTPEHAAIQKRLLELSTRGVFLAVASRNETSDVEMLFRERQDFPLSLEHFSSLEVGWRPKSLAISAACERLRIGEDSVLFVDDNPGELAEVSSVHDKVRTLLAVDPSETLRALELFPGLLAWHDTPADRLRLADMNTASARDRLRSELDPAAYLRSLEIELRVSLDTAAHVERLHELAQRTNQFNLALARTPEAEIASYTGGSDRAAVGIWLRDKLSDSGLIGLVLGRCTENRVIVDELCVSCRALGRQLEDLIVGEAVEHLLRWSSATKVGFSWRRGPRNRPALDWLEKVSGESPSPEQASGGVVWVGAEAVLSLSRSLRDLVKIGDEVLTDG